VVAILPTTLHRASRAAGAFQERKIELDRIAAMLSRLGGRGYGIKEDSVPYQCSEFDFDPDEMKGSPT
jgi:hypothetical protein